MRILIFVVVIFFGFASQAFLLDFNLDAFDGNLSTTSDSKNSRLFGSIGLMADLSKSDSVRINFGFSLINVHLKNELGSNASESLTSLDMGPSIRWNIDDHKLYSLSAVYGVFAKGKYESSGISQSLTGNSYYFKFAIEPEVSERIHLGFALNYYSVQYGSAVINSVESSVAYKNSWFFPSISLAFRL